MCDLSSGQLKSEERTQEIPATYSFWQIHHPRDRYGHTAPWRTRKTHQNYHQTPTNIASTICCGAAVTYGRARTINPVPAHKPHSPAVIQRLALLSSEASHRPEYFSSRNINIADVAAAKTLQRSPTFGGVPSEESSTVPIKARNALTQVGMEILRPSSANAKNGTNLTLRYSKNALRLMDGILHTCGCEEGDGAAHNYI